MVSALNAIARKPRLMVRMVLKAVSGLDRTVRFSTVPIVDSQGNPWDPMLVDEPDIDQRGSFLSTDIDLCDLELVIRDYQMPGQATGAKFSHLLKDYVLVGSQVVIYQWDEGIAANQTYTIFAGEVDEVLESSVGEIRLHVVQAREWDRAFPSRVIERTKFPEAPDDAVGIVYPVFYGNWYAKHMYLNLPSAAKHVRWRAGVARAASPASPWTTGRRALPWIRNKFLPTHAGRT